MEIDRCEIIEKLASENHISCEVYDESSRFGSGARVVAVEICWGDWKHDHLRLKWLVRERFPEMRGVESFVTEEDGSDCYSAIHRFYF